MWTHDAAALAPKKASSPTEIILDNTLILQTIANLKKAAETGMLDDTEGLDFARELLEFAIGKKFSGDEWPAAESSEDASKKIADAFVRAETAVRVRIKRILATLVSPQDLYTNDANGSFPKRPVELNGRRIFYLDELNFLNRPLETDSFVEGLRHVTGCARATSLAAAIDKAMAFIETEKMAASHLSGNALDKQEKLAATDLAEIRWGIMSGRRDPDYKNFDADNIRASLERAFTVLSDARKTIASGDLDNATELFTQAMSGEEFKNLSARIAAHNSADSLISFQTSVSTVIAAGALSEIALVAATPYIEGAFVTTRGGSALRELARLFVSSSSFVTAHGAFEVPLTGKNPYDSTKGMWENLGEYGKEVAYTMAMFKTIGAAASVTNGIATKVIEAVAKTRLVARGAIEAGAAGTEAAKKLIREEAAKMLAARGFAATGSFLFEVASFQTYEYAKGEAERSLYGADIDPEMIFTPGPAMESAKFLIVLRFGRFMAAPVTKPLHGLVADHVKAKIGRELAAFQKEANGVLEELTKVNVRNPDPAALDAAYSRLTNLSRERIRLLSILARLGAVNPEAIQESRAMFERFKNAQAELKRAHKPARDPGTLDALLGFVEPPLNPGEAGILGDFGDKPGKVLNDARRIPSTVDEFLQDLPPSLRGIVDADKVREVGLEKLTRHDFRKWITQIIEHRPLTVEELAFFRTLARRAIETGYFFPEYQWNGKKAMEASFLYYIVGQFGELLPIWRGAELPQQSESFFGHFDEKRLLLALERFEDALGPLRGSPFPSLGGDLENVFWGDEGKKMFFEMMHDYASQRGLDTGAAFSLTLAAHDLSAIADSYDLVIPIAKGGLFSGAVADLLGLKTRVMEVHAHDRETPTFRWVDSVTPEDIRGKRILLLDKDTVTGASILEAVRQLEPFGPADIGVYFNHPPVMARAGKKSEDVSDIRAGSYPEAFPAMERAGVRIHHPENIPQGELLPVFFNVNERLKTPLGRLRLAARNLEDIAGEFSSGSAVEAEVIGEFVREQTDLFFALNQYTPGMEEVRLGIVRRMEEMAKRYRESLRAGLVAGGDNPSMETQLAVSALSYTPLQPGFPDDLLKARYVEAGEKKAKSRGVENPHLPMSYSHSLRVALEAVKDKYDVALIVGPEGFAYEPIFEELGLPTVAVNIPESDPGGARTFMALGSLSGLEGKRVLVVEDDIHTGATLRRLIEKLTEMHRPQSMGLYLGQPADFQRLENVPAVFEKTYVAAANDAANETALMGFLGEGGRDLFFKGAYEPARFRTDPRYQSGLASILLLKLENPYLPEAELQLTIRQIFGRGSWVAKERKVEAAEILWKRAGNIKRLRELLEPLNDNHLDEAISIFYDLSDAARRRKDTKTQRTYARVAGHLVKLYDERHGH